MTMPSGSCGRPGGRSARPPTASSFSPCCTRRPRSRTGAATSPRRGNCSRSGWPTRRCRIRALCVGSVRALRLAAAVAGDAGRGGRRRPIRDRLEPVPAAVGERCGELMRFGRLLSARTPPARAYQAAVAAEFARAGRCLPRGRLGGGSTGMARGRRAVAAGLRPVAGGRGALPRRRLEGRRRGRPRGQFDREPHSGAQPLAAEAAALARRARLSLDDPRADEAGAVAAAGEPGTITSTGRRIRPRAGRRRGRRAARRRR